MVLCLGIFARAQTEEQGNLGKVDSSLGDLEGGFGCCCGFHEKARGGILLSLMRGVLVIEVPEHAGEALIDIS